TYVRRGTVISISVTDPSLPGSFAGSGVASCATTKTYTPTPQISHPACAPTTQTYVLTASDGQGVYTFAANGTDNVGNVGGTSTKIVRLDESAPTATGSVSGTPSYTSG